MKNLLLVTVFFTMGFTSIGYSDTCPSTADNCQSSGGCSLTWSMSSDKGNATWTLQGAAGNGPYIFESAAGNTDGSNASCKMKSGGSEITFIDSEDILIPQVAMDTSWTPNDGSMTCAPPFNTTTPNNAACPFVPG